MVVTTIEEVEIQLAFLYGTGDKKFEAYPRSNRLKGENPYTGFNNWQDAITPEEDYSLTTNQNFIDWENERFAKITDDEIRKQEQKGIRTLAENAAQFTAEIKLVFTAIKNAQFTRLNTDSTFVAVTDALNDVAVGQGFRNVVTDAYNAQGITVDLTNIGSETTAQKERFNAFCDYFFTSWAFMATLN